MAVLLPLDKAAEVLGGISIWTLRKHAAVSNVRVTRLGRRVFLDEEEMSRIMREGLPSLRNNEKGERSAHPGDGATVQVPEPGGSSKDQSQEFAVAGLPDAALKQLNSIKDR
jgi:hypothetical protein